MRAPTASPVDRAMEALRALARSERPGVRLPSERDLAARAGVSHAAVNRAVHRLLAGGVLRREGYRLEVAGGARAGVLRRVVVLADPTLAWFEDLAVAEVEARGLEAERARVAVPESYTEALASWRPVSWAGILAAPPYLPRLDHSLLADLHRRGQPLVVLGDVGLAVPTAHFSVAGAARLLARHLSALGHASVVMATLPEEHPHRDNLEWWLRGAAAAEGMACMVWPTRTGEDSAAAWRRLRRDHPTAAAVVFADPSLAAGVVREARRVGVAVPGELSVAALADAPAARESRPAVTAADYDWRLVLRLGLENLAVQAEVAATTARSLPALGFHMEPVLHVRASTGQAAGAVRAGRRAQETWPAWPADAGRRRREAELTWERAYPALPPSSAAGWFPMNLGGLALRDTSRARGWFGDLPLRGLKPGPLRVHGVPFVVAADRSGTAVGAVVFRSRHARRQGGIAAPSTARVELGRCVARLFFLHACGWGGAARRFASYRVVHAGGAEVEVPLIPRGGAPEEEAPAGANVQDWYPTYPRLSTEHARPLVLTLDGDPRRYHRTLYTLEWVNPSPGEVVEAVEVASDPRATSTLALLAVTALLVEPDGGRNRAR